MPRVDCSCGAALAVAEVEAGKDRTCPACGATFRVVWASSPAGRVLRRATAVRVPPGSFEVHCPCGQVLVARREHSGRTLACPVCKSPMTVETYRDPQTLHTRIRRREPGSTTVVQAERRQGAAPGGEDVLCPCGESLRVSMKHLDKQAMCPACGALMRLESVRDPETRLTRVLPRIVGRGAPPPPPPAPPAAPPSAADSWSLDDFA